MRLHRSAAILVTGLVASAFIFLASLFALHYDEEQPIGKNFQVILHDAYGAYVSPVTANFTTSGSVFKFNIASELLDFTNSSRNWHLPNHKEFADFTADISFDHLLRAFGGDTAPTNTSTATLDSSYNTSEPGTEQASLFERAVAAAKSAMAGLTTEAETEEGHSTHTAATAHRIEKPDDSTPRKWVSLAWEQLSTRLHPLHHPAAPLDAFDPAELHHLDEEVRRDAAAVAASGGATVTKAAYGDTPHSNVKDPAVPTRVKPVKPSLRGNTATQTTISSIDANMTCQKSFEPTCTMYPYVRFWNQRFYPEDCYRSPLRPPALNKEKTAADEVPYHQQKYVVFEPDWGGWNNIRMAAETVIIFAHATGRTLVMPPEMKFYLLDRNPEQEENQSTFHKFFDFAKVREALRIITMEEFVEQVAKKGLLKKPFPEGVLPIQRTKLYSYMEQACHMREWEPGYHFIGFNLSHQNKDIFGTFQRDKQKQPRYREMVAHGRALIPYDREMDAERAIYFYGRYDKHRMLTHFYTYLYWEDAHVEQIYKRIVRDRLHYHDDIFCGAGRVVQLLHANEAQVSRKPLPSPAHASPKTLGGDTNRDATYHAYHIRRGDFQYKETRLSAEQLWANTRHLLDPAVSTLIYIATDERNHSFFEPFMQPPFRVKFLSDYEYALQTTSSSGDKVKVNRNHLGMMEQVICANAHTFIGTARSTFTGYITRMRGYYRDGRYARTFYTMKELMYSLHQQRGLVGPFWAREFEKAHHDIDDYWKETNTTTAEGAGAGEGTDGKAKRLAPH